MKARTIKRHFRESAKNLRRNGWMTFASVSAVTVTLLLVGVFLVIMLNMNKVATDIENDVEIRVHIELEANEVDKQLLKEEIEDLDGVERVIYSSKEKELQRLINDLGEEFALIEQNNPLYDVYVVKAKHPTDTPKLAKEIETFQSTEAVVFGERKVKKLFNVLQTSRNIGLGLSIGLLFTAMFLISNTIKITIFARRKEIEIMRLVGATNGFIRAPFLLEGLWLGLLGSIIPVLTVVIGYYYLYEAITARLGEHFIQMIAYFPFVLQISGIMLLISAFIGMWGSFMSVRKFLRI